MPRQYVHSVDVNEKRTNGEASTSKIPTDSLQRYSVFSITPFIEILHLVVPIKYYLVLKIPRFPLNENNSTPMTNCKNAQKYLSNLLNYYAFGR